jgi:Flp pilus assembly protein TadB
MDMTGGIPGCRGKLVRTGEIMDPKLELRREVAIEIRQLAEEFERGDEAAFRRTRIVCWAVTAAVTVAVLLLLLAGADWRYLGAFWIAILGLTWVGYWASSRRQRQQTGLLRDLADRWMGGTPAA